MEIQKRLLKKVICRSTESEDNSKQIEGFLPYDTPSEKMFIGYADAEQEVITKTAWKKGLADKRNVFLNYNHNPDLILGSSKSGTMTLEDRDDGLHFKATLPDTDIGNRAFQTIKRGDVQTLSFEFIPYDWEVKDNIVYLRSGRLEAISVCVSYPAYTATECHTTNRNLKEQIRNLSATIKTKRNIQQMDKETLDELKNLLTQILEALPKEDRKEPEEDKEEKKADVKAETEKEPDLKEETPEQPKDTQAEETDKAEEKEVDPETEAKLKELEELKKELEELQNA